MKVERGKYYIISLTCALLVNSVQAQDTIPAMQLTFEQAVEITGRQSHVIRQVNYLQKEKDQEAKASKALYLPKVGITATYMMLSENLMLDLNPVKETITPLYSTLSKYGNFSGVLNPSTGQILPDVMSTQAVRGQLAEGLQRIEAANWNEMIQKKEFGVVAATFQWPLFVGGKIGAANKAASIEKHEVNEVLRQKQGELMSELVERYFALSLARQAVAVRSDVLKGMQKHVSDAEKMQQQGLIAHAEVLHARVFHAQAERELTKARRTVETINQALTNTLALESDTVIQPTTELFYVDTIEPLAYFQTLAENKNPLLLQVDGKKQLAKQKYNAERADFFPAVALQGMYNLADKDLSAHTPDWMVGVGLKWILFDGASRFRKLKAASLKQEQVKEIELKAQFDIATMIGKLYNELHMYREQLTELETAKQFAEEYLKIRQKAFSEEMTNATEVVDANLALAGIRIERLQAMYNYDLSLAKLLQYSGIPEEFSAYRQRTNAKTESYGH